MSRKLNSVTRKESALERKTFHENLSIEERIKSLDSRLGVGIGAEKERAKLAYQLEHKDDVKIKKEKKEKKEVKSGNFYN
jgi:hypothetical protein